MRKECAGRLPVEELAPFFCEGFGRPGVKEHRELTGNTLQNPSDPDATYNGHKGQGFMMQVMEAWPNSGCGAWCRCRIRCSWARWA